MTQYKMLVWCSSTIHHGVPEIMSHNFEADAKNLKLTPECLEAKAEAKAEAKIWPRGQSHQ